MSWYLTLHSVFLTQCYEVNRVVVVQLLSHVWLFVTPWTAACQASLSSTISRSLLRFMTIESLLLSNHLILCCPLLLLPSIVPSIEPFQMSRLFTSDGQSTRASASATVLPMNILGWFPLVLTGLISLVSKGLSRVFSTTTIQKHQFFGYQPSSWRREWQTIPIFLLENPTNSNIRQI